MLFRSVVVELSADGGKLDYDDTNGYGPEHWTLLNTDTIRWGQTYRVRVHYYSDHSGDSTTIPSTYTVNVVLYEGTDRATTASYTGVLSVDNSSNSSPSSTGPDWANVLDIIPVQSTSNGQPQIIRSPTGMKKLLVPVSNDDLAPKQESPPRQ